MVYIFFIIIFFIIIFLIIWTLLKCPVSTFNEYQYCRVCFVSLVMSTTNQVLQITSVKSTETPIFCPGTINSYCLIRINSKIEQKEVLKLWKYKLEHNLDSDMTPGFCFDSKSVKLSHTKCLTEGAPQKCEMLLNPNIANRCVNVRK